MRVTNDANTFTARLGMYDGQLYTFTHRNPSTGELWGEDIPVGRRDNGKPIYGTWVRAEKVRLA